MYLWRKRASQTWLANREEVLRSEYGERVAVIERPGQKGVLVEVACTTRVMARDLETKLGGRAELLPRNWLGNVARAQKTKPLKIGQRLVIHNVGGTSVSRPSRRRGPSHIVIPAGLAFGTGEHATTAMSLRMLERVTRSPEKNWSLLDLGTGSGIFALAAKRLGAKRVLALDFDPVAIRTARTNVRLNKIKGIKFAVSDVTKLPAIGQFDIVMANLYSALLIDTLLRIRRCLKDNSWLILSGILRTQERELMRAVRRNGFERIERRRRGKWIALLAQKKGRA